MEMTLSRIIESAKEVLEIEANSILRLKDNIGEDFDRAIDILYNCKGRVIVTGMGKSGIIGKKIAATMSSTGTPAYFLHPAESTTGIRELFPVMMLLLPYQTAAKLKN
jgi:arabinose-5-phosphate isomerase